MRSRHHVLVLNYRGCELRLTEDALVAGLAVLARCRRTLRRGVHLLLAVMSSLLLAS